MLHVYKKRRLTALDKTRINSRIKTCKKAIKRIEDRESKVKRLDALVMEFFDVVSMRGSNSAGRVSDDLFLLARKVFYKYGMENGIKGSQLERYTGASSWTAGRSRMQFTRSFTNNKNNYEKWKQFAEYQKMK